MQSVLPGPDSFKPESFRESVKSFIQFTAMLETAKPTVFISHFAAKLFNIFLQTSDIDQNFALRP